MFAAIRNLFFPRVVQVSMRIKSRTERVPLYDAGAAGRASTVSHVCDIEVLPDAPVKGVSLRCEAIYEKPHVGAAWVRVPLAGLQNAFAWKCAGVKVDLDDVVGGAVNILRDNRYEWSAQQWGGRATKHQPTLVLPLCAASGPAQVCFSTSSSLVVQLALKSPDMAIADLRWVVSILDNRGVRTEALKVKRPAFLPPETAQEKSCRKSLVPKRVFRWKRIFVTLLLGLGLVILMLEKANVIMDFIANVGDMLTKIKD